MKSCFSIKIPHATTSDTMVQALLMLIQLLVILLACVGLNCVSLNFGLVCAALGSDTNECYMVVSAIISGIFRSKGLMCVSWFR